MDITEEFDDCYPILTNVILTSFDFIVQQAEENSNSIGGFLVPLAYHIRENQLSHHKHHGM